MAFDEVAFTENNDITWESAGKKNGCKKLQAHLALHTPKQKIIKIYENIERKGEIALKEQFLLFPQCFFLFIVSINFPPFLPHLKSLCPKSFNIRQPKICRLRIANPYPAELKYLTSIKPDFSLLNDTGWGVSLAETVDRASESVGHDQTARMCRLILIYTLRKFSLWSRTAYGVNVRIIRDRTEPTKYHRATNRQCAK